MPPQLMPAAVYAGGGRLDVRHLPTPVPGNGEVLVEISHCGVCGTDLHLVLERYARPDSILGHEWSGTVAAAGPGADDWVPGTRVVGRPTPACGVCRPCRRGRPSVCLHRDAPDLLAFNGAFCQYLSTGATNLSVVPHGLSLRHAALAEPTAITLHALSLAGVEPEDRVLITGAGPVGLLTVAVLHARGVADITVTDPSPVRRARAGALGAARTLAPDALGPAPMGRPVAEPFAVAFECSGRANAAESALDHLDYAGVLVFVGTGGQSPRVNHNRMIVLELSAIGTYNYDAAGFAPALQLLAGGTLPLDLLIEPADVPLRGLPAALEGMAAGTIAAKVLVRPEVS